MVARRAGGRNCTRKRANEPGSQKEQDLIEDSPREVYNPEENILDFRKSKVTDLRNKPRVELTPSKTTGGREHTSCKETTFGECH